MSKKTLLLNASYEVLSFIPEKKVFKFLVKDKVEVVSTWEDSVNLGSSKLRHPSILRLKNHVRRNFFNASFSRKALIKRDKSTCQYCSKKLIASQITIDHVVPRAQGGGTSFANCVISCQMCNARKADRTPEQASMSLLKKPMHPSFTSCYYVSDPQDHWHSDWDDFLSGM